MTPALADADVTLWHGDALDVLRGMDADSVDCVVTSPPYLGLRDYGAEGQIGLEASLGEYVDKLVQVFSEARRVMCDHATLWLNLGDSYNAYNGGAGPSSALSQTQSAAPRLATGFGLQQKELKPKDLMGIPWRVAFALQADGWWLRSDIVWAKPNPMPESVTDRPTKAHEYVFLLTKQPRYWFDQEAVREPFSENSLRDERLYNNGARRTRNSGGRSDGYTVASGTVGNPESGRNIRSVWDIPTEPYAGAHFATFPQELVRRCVLSGCASEICRTCGKPRRRLIEAGEPQQHPNRWGDKAARQFDGEDGDYAESPTLGKERLRRTTGWSDCGHNTWRPGRVLDPFVGSGTTCLVARNHGRHSVGIDLNEQYLALAATRLQQQSLFSEVP